MTSISFEAFVQMLRSQLGLDGADPLRPDQALAGDLGLDSFGALELLDAIERAVPAEQLPAAPPTLRTVGDAFGYYLSLTAAAVDTMYVDGSAEGPPPTPEPER